MEEKTQKRIGRPPNGATANLNVGMPPDLKKKLMLYAKNRHRSASSLASLILRRWIESNPETPENDDD